MKLATLQGGGPDGRLAVVSPDGRTLATAPEIPTLQAALERWTEAEPQLRRLEEALDQGSAPAAVPVESATFAAPLPRAWQWLDGSAFKAHADLATRAYRLDSTWGERPLMYQGLSHRFLGPNEDVVFPTEADEIDFEGEFGVITGPVGMGANAREGRDAIRLLVQINDWSLRRLGREEMARGFGWIQGKPACSVAPYAITPDELGGAWTDARIALPLHVWRGETLFGRASGAEMSFGFDELVAHAAYSRDLCAGTIIGSGTVANLAYPEVGSSCILERRGIDILEFGEPRCPFLTDGEQVRMAARQGEATPFGTIDQRVRVLEARSKGGG